MKIIKLSYNSFIAILTFVFLNEPSTARPCSAKACIRNLTGSEVQISFGATGAYGETIGPVSNQSKGVNNNYVCATVFGAPNGGGYCDLNVAQPNVKIIVKGKDGTTLNFSPTNTDTYWLTGGGFFNFTVYHHIKTDCSTKAGKGLWYSNKQNNFCVALDSWWGQENTTKLPQKRKK